MMQTIFSLLVAKRGMIGIGLVILLTGGAVAYGWSRYQNAALQRTLAKTRAELDQTRLQLATVWDAQKSCEGSLRQIVTAARKKQSAIKIYEEKIHKGETDAIGTLDEFINFARRMQ